MNDLKINDIVTYKVDRWTSKNNGGYEEVIATGRILATLSGTDWVKYTICDEKELQIDSNVKSESIISKEDNE